MVFLYPRLFSIGECSQGAVKIADGQDQPDPGLEEPGAIILSSQCGSSARFKGLAGINQNTLYISSVLVYTSLCSLLMYSNYRCVR